MKISKKTSKITTKMLSKMLLRFLDGSGVKVSVNLVDLENLVFRTKYLVSKIGVDTAENETLKVC